MSQRTGNQAQNQYRRFIDEPNMSDKTLLVSVEDLISGAFGTVETNKVNFKMVQMVLHILARQMRLLEQEVEIKLDDVGLETKGKDEKKDEYQQYSDDSFDDADDASLKEELEEDDAQREGRDEDEGGGAKGGGREKKGEKKSKDRDKADRGSSKDRDKADRKDRGKSGERGERGEGGGRGGERGGDRGGERDERRDGERGGDRGGEQDEEQGGERDGDRGGARDEGRGGERGGDRGGARDEGRGGERGGDRGGERGGERGADRGGDKGGGRGGDKTGDRGGKGGKGGERGGERGKKGQSGAGVQGKGPGKEGSRTSIIVSEAERKGGKGAKDKILVVEKGPTTRADSRTRVGSIEVVTASQFALLENAVKQLMTVAGPLPMPALPDNAKLRQDLAKGTASLTETMQAMQINARVQAAEQALTRMAGLLTQLAAAGALPEDMANRLGEFEAELQQAAAAAATVTASVGTDTRAPATGPGAAVAGKGKGRAGGKGGPGAAAGRGGPGGTAGAGGPGVAAGGGGPGGVIGGGGPGGVVGGGGPGGAAGGGGPGGAAGGWGPGGAGGGGGPGGAAGGGGPGGVAGGGGPGGAAGGWGPGGAAGGGGQEGVAGGGGQEGVAGGWDFGGAVGGGGPGGAGAGGGPGGGGSGGARKSVAIDAQTLPTGGGSRPDSAKGDQRSGAASTRGSVSGGAVVGVSHPEMDDVLQIMKDQLMKEIAAMTAKAAHTSDSASNTAKSVADKLDIALKLDKRINVLYSQTADYAEQLSGFDSGLTTQMASFQEQMLQMRTDLKGGIMQLDQANNNAETSALAELTQRYEGLVIELDNTLHTHQGLTALQRQLSEELRSLVECVEMLREQKADRDEVFDGLRDKADITRLAGLLHEDDFAVARVELERRLDLCYEKFRKQDRVWLAAIADLSGISAGKAEILELLSIKDNATDELKKIQEMLRKLYIMLGEPKAAVLTRKLAQGAVCAGCLAPALMLPQDANYGKPFPLASLRPPPLGEETCLTDMKLPMPPDAREHVCRRWVGGSHTLMADNVTRERAHATHAPAPPTKRYAGYGTDGRLYMLEEELQPCLECNMLGGQAPAGAGDVGGGEQPAAGGAGGDKGTGDQGDKISKTDNVAVPKKSDTGKE